MGIAIDVAVIARVQYVNEVEVAAFHGHVHSAHASLVSNSQVSSFAKQVGNDLCVTCIGSSLESSPVILVKV